MKRIALIALVIMSALLAACGGQPDTAGSPTAPPTATPTEECDDQTDQAQITLTQNNNFFEPDCLVVDGGQTVEIQNRGASLHNFSITGTQVDNDTPPGEQTGLESIGEAVSPGTYDFFCKYHLGMTGEITVV